MADGVCQAPDECWIAPAAVCPHGLVSWWLVLRTLDRPLGAALRPAQLLPRLDRLDPASRSYVAVLDAHHAALLAGQPGYRDPVTGLFAQTARSLFDRGTCCGQGCRHCPFS